MKYSHSRLYSMIPAHLHHWQSLNYVLYLLHGYTTTRPQSSLRAGFRCLVSGSGEEGGRRLRESEGWITHPQAHLHTCYQSRPSNGRDKPLLTSCPFTARVTWLWNFDVYFLFKIFIADWQELKISKELEKEKKKATIFYHLTKKIKQWRMKNVL